MPDRGWAIGEVETALSVRAALTIGRRRTIAGGSREAFSSGESRMVPPA